MQSLTLALLIGMTVLLLGCGLFSDGRTTEGSEAGTVSTVAVDVRPPAYLGATSLESRILASPVIARVRLDSIASTTELGTTYRGMKHLTLLEFSFSVLEYLKGDDDIVAVWGHSSFDTLPEAEDALPAIAAARDAQWDNHDAIVFLQRSATYLPSTQQADRFFFSGVHLVGGVSDDYYSLGSRGNKLWLPAEASTGSPSQPNGDQQRFLIDVPLTTGTAPTITLGELKTRIAAVTARLDAGDGSEQYRECVERAYRFEGRDQYRTSIGDESLFTGTPDGKLASGLSASSVVHEAIAYTDISNYALQSGSKGKTRTCSASSSATRFRPTSPEPTGTETCSNSPIAWCRHARSQQVPTLPTTTTGMLILFRARGTPTATTGRSPSSPPKAPCTRRSSIR